MFWVRRNSTYTTGLCIFVLRVNCSQRNDRMLPSRNAGGAYAHAIRSTCTTSSCRSDIVSRVNSYLCNFISTRASSVSILLRVRFLFMRPILNFTTSGNHLTKWQNDLQYVHPFRSFNFRINFRRSRRSRNVLSTSFRSLSRANLSLSTRVISHFGKTCLEDGQDFEDVNLFHFLIFFTLLLFTRFFRLTHSFLFRDHLFRIFCLLLRINRFLAYHTNAFLFDLHFLSNAGNVFSFNVQFLRRPFYLFFNFLRSFLTTTFRLLCFLFMANSNVFRLFFPLTCILALNFPMALITCGVLRMFITLSMFASRGFQYIDGGLFQRASFANGLCNGQASQVAGLRLRRHPRLITIMRRNSIRRSFIVFNGVLRILMIDNGRTRHAFRIRTFRRNFNGNATGL